MFACEHLVKNPDQKVFRWLIYQFCEACWKSITEERSLNVKMYPVKQ